MGVGVGVGVGLAVGLYSYGGSFLMNKKVEEALEQVRCAMANMENMKRTMPAAGASPFYKVVMMQLEAAELILIGREEDGTV